MFDKAEYWRRRHNTVKTQVPDGGKKKKDGSPRMKTIEVPRPLRGQGDRLPRYGKSLLEATDPKKSEYVWSEGGGVKRRHPKPITIKARRKNTKRARKEALNGSPAN